jgi:hypothetical protein
VVVVLLSSNLSPANASTSRSPAKKETDSRRLIAAPPFELYRLLVDID